MKGQNIAIRYATALYEVAVEANTLHAVIKDMAFIENLMDESPEIKHYCQKKHKAGSQELEFAEIAFLAYVSEHTEAMIKTAVQNERLSALPLIPQAFQNIHDERSGTARVLLETAHEPAEGLLDIIRERMRKRTDKEIKIEHVVNPDLLGGFKLWHDGRLIDNSAAGRLVRMRRLLKSI